MGHVQVESLEGLNERLTEARVRADELAVQVQDSQERREGSRIHTYMCVLAHAYIHDRMHMLPTHTLGARARTHARTHAHTHTHTHTLPPAVDALPRWYLRDHLLSCLDACTYTCMRAHIHACVHIYMHACTYTCMRAHNHTYMHACT